MTVDEIIHHLGNNVLFRMKVVIGNNPDSVHHNFNQTFGVSTLFGADALFSFAKELYEVGSKEEKNLLNRALDVPFLPDNATDSLNRAFDVIIAKKRQLKN